MMLTDCSPEEQAVMEELKRRTADCVTPKMVEDDYLFYRFSKARDFNLAEAETMLRNHVCMRKEFGIDTILKDYKPPEVLVKYVPTCLMCFDKEGCAVRYTDGGQCDTKGLWNCAKKKELFQFFCYRIEQDKVAVLKRNKKHVCMRKEFGIDTILKDYKPPEVLVKYVPTCLMCFDKEGCAVRYTDGGQCDTKGLWNCAKKKELFQFFCYRIEQDKVAVLKRNKKFGKQMFLPIFEFENLTYASIVNMKSLWNCAKKKELFQFFCYRIEQDKVAVLKRNKKFGKQMFLPIFEFENLTYASIVNMKSLWNCAKKKELFQFFCYRIEQDKVAVLKRNKKFGKQMFLPIFEFENLTYASIVNMKSLWNCAKKKELFQFFCYRIEQDKVAVLKRNKKFGKQMFLPIFEFENLTYASIVNMKTIQYVLYFLKTYIDNYPEALKYAFVINAPFYFVWAFNIFKQVLPSAVVQKIRIFGTDGWKEELLKFIDAEVLPACLGGNKTDPDGNPQCKTIVKRGEPIPRSCYMTNEKTKLGVDFEKLTILPLCKEEISFEVKEANSDLEWEYEIKSRDINFSLHFKGEYSEPIELIPTQRTDTCYETEKGFFKCEKEGTYTMVLDNTYSWIYPKEVYFKAAVKPPNYNRTTYLL